MTGREATPAPRLFSKRWNLVRRAGKLSMSNLPSERLWITEMHVAVGGHWDRSKKQAWPDGAYGLKGNVRYDSGVHDAAPQTWPDGTRALGSRDRNRAA